MHYDFPIIRHIDDVLPAIKGRDEFNVLEKEGYTVITYNIQLSDSFRFGEDPVPNETYALRRECRGIIFDQKTGKILRRPLNKFFNVGEHVEVLPERIDLSKNFYLLEKMDGSMVAPFFVGDRLVWGTKAGDTDVSKPVYDFVDDRYLGLTEYLLTKSFTPIFEWCSRKQRIVLDYPEDRLVMLAIRDMETGTYMPYEEVKDLCRDNRVPVVDFLPCRNNELGGNLDRIIHYTRGLTDHEGFVIAFEDGHRAKIKSDWYVAIHQAKEAILWDRNIVRLILDKRLDDVKPHLLEEDRVKIEEFEAKISSFLKNHPRYLYSMAHSYVNVRKMDRKTFALEFAKFFNDLDKALIFSLWDNNSLERAQELVRKTLEKNLTKNSNYSKMQSMWFPGAIFNEKLTESE